jgi:hypothetical protein
MTSSAGEVREQVRYARERALDSIGSLDQAVDFLEDAQRSLLAATHDTGQEEVRQASSTLSGAVESIKGAREMINVTITQAENYEGRL